MILSTSDANGLLTPQSGLSFVLFANGETVFFSLKIFFNSGNILGSIFWTLTLNQMRSRCKMEISTFPFDVQTCYITFGSIINTEEELDYNLFSTSNFIYNYTENKQWSLISKTAVKNAAVRIGLNYTELKFKIVIRRKPLFILTNIVILALILSKVTIVTFFIPFAQAIVISISVILAYSMLGIIVHILIK